MSLKLNALDKEDLEILSATLQNAWIKSQDMVYLAKEKRFVFHVSRFCWEEASHTPPQFMRCYAGVHFNRVEQVQTRGFDQQPQAKNEPYELLTLQFEPTAEPSGYVTLFFADKSAIRLQVECIEAQLSDQGSPWATSGCPNILSEQRV